MRAMEQTIHIEAPVEKVFDFFVDSYKDRAKAQDLMDLTEFPRTRVDDLKPTKEGTGSYTSWHVTVAGLPVARGFQVVTDMVPAKHITERSSNTMVGTWDYDFEPEGSGTKVTMKHYAESFWRIPPMRSLMDWVTGRMTESFTRRLKATIERPAD